MTRTDAESKAYEDGFQEGAEYVLNYLSDLYEGVEDTDVWADFFPNAEDKKQIGHKQIDKDKRL